MDLSFVKEQLETFATFAGAIKDFLQLPPQILDQLSSLSSDAPADTGAGGSDAPADTGAGGDAGGAEG